MKKKILGFWKQAGKVWKYLSNHESFFTELSRNCSLDHTERAVRRKLSNQRGKILAPVKSVCAKFFFTFSFKNWLKVFNLYLHPFMFSKIVTKMFANYTAYKSHLFLVLILSSLVMNSSDVFTNLFHQFFFHSFSSWKRKTFIGQKQFFFV